MPALRFQVFWLGIGWLALTAVAVLSLIPVPQVGPSDKLNHLLVYGALMAWFAALQPRRRHLRLAVLLAGFGVLLEAAQGLTAQRMPSLLDATANTAGVVLAWLLLRDRLRAVLAWLEARLPAASQTGDTP